MPSFNLDQFSILEPRLDWISIIGEIPHIFYDDPDVKTEIETKFYDWGLAKLPKRDRLTFRSNIMGMEISLGKKRNSGNRYVKIEIQGKGCADSIEHTESKIKEVVEKVWSYLGVTTPPHATRIDIAVDVLGAKVTDIFPDLSKKRYALVSNSAKSKRPTLVLSKHYSNTTDLSDQTGFTIKNSRFVVCVYDRILALNDKYEHQENGAAYCAYYNELYKGYDRVLRIETRASKELCDFFNMAFFTNKKTLREILPEALAHFNHHHSFKDVVNNKPLEHLDRLYFSNQYKSIKTLKSELGLDLKIEKLFYNFGSSHYEIRIKQLARSLVRSGKTSKEDLQAVVHLLLLSINDSASDLEGEIEAFKKTCAFLNFHPEEQEKQKEEFLNAVRELRILRANNQALLKGDEFFTEIEKQIKELGL